MTRSAALLGLVGGVTLIAVAYFGVFATGTASPWMTWVYMIGTSTTMLAMMVLGAVRGTGGIRGLMMPFTAIYVLLIVGFGAVLLMPPESAESTLWLGLPPRTAIVLYGIGILPLLLLPLAYAFTFDSTTLSEADLARVGEMRRLREATMFAAEDAT